MRPFEVLLLGEQRGGGSGKPTSLQVCSNTLVLALKPKAKALHSHRHRACATGQLAWIGPLAAQGGESCVRQGSSICGAFMSGEGRPDRKTD